MGTCIEQSSAGMDPMRQLLAHCGRPLGCADAEPMMEGELHGDDGEVSASGVTYVSRWLTEREWGAVVVDQ